MFVQKRNKYVFYVLLIMLLLGITIISCLDSVSYETEASIGNPEIIYDQIRLETRKINQVACDSSNIYILINEPRGTILVYSIQGEYEYAISFYVSMNGNIRMSQSQGLIYVLDTLNNIYIFNNGVLSNFVSSNETQNIIDQLDFNIASDYFRLGYGFSYSTVYYDDSVQITRPLYSLFFQYHMGYLLIVLLIVLIEWYSKYLRNQ